MASMDMEYGINVRNPFDLLMDDEQDPDDLIQEMKVRSEQEAKKNAAAKKAEKKKAASMPKPVPVTPTSAEKDKKPDTRRDFGDKENRPRGGFGGRGRGRGGPRGGQGGQSGGPTNLPPRLAGQQQQINHWTADESTGENTNRGGFGSPGVDKMADRFGESRGRGGRGRGGRGRGGPRGGGFGGGNEFGGEQQGDESRGGFGGGGIGVFGEDEQEKQMGGGGGFGRAGVDQGYGGGRGFGRGRGRGGEGGGFGRGRGRGEYRGGRGRQFDRQSGSDKAYAGGGPRPGPDKRGGFGKGNWGTDNDELKGETEALNTTTGSDPEAAPPALTDATHDKNDDKKKEGVEGDEAQEAEKTEEELMRENQLTLDEWRAQQQPKNKPAFNIRKAGEGEDQKEWKKLVPLERDLNNTEDSDEYIVEQKQAKRAVVNIDIQFSDGGVMRGGGGGRGGRGGRGGFRGDDERGDRGFGGRGGRGGMGGGEFRRSRGGGFGGMGRGGGGPPPGRRDEGRSGRGGEFRMDQDSFPELGAN